MISDTSRIEALFAPLQIRTLHLSNRFVMAPMTRNFSPGGVPGENVAAYYERRVRGDVGLIITEGVGVDHAAALGVSGLGDDDIPFMHGEAAIAGWRHVVQRVHAAGGKIIPQLWHQGVVRRGGGPAPHAESVRPSGVWGPAGGATIFGADYLEWAKTPTRAATDEEVQDVIDAFARSARLAVAAGFDGIAIHGAHGYMLDTFLWGETNRRGAPWGGIGHRARTAVPAAVVKAIRAESSDLPIFYRFSQWKLQDFRAALATTPDELAAILEPLAEAGVDVFDASSRYFDRAEFPQISAMNLAGWAKRLTGRRSMTVGGIGLGGSLFAADGPRTGIVPGVNNLPQLLDRLARGEFDLAAVGRALIADPEWVRKARLGAAFRDYDETAQRTLY